MQKKINDDDGYVVALSNSTYHHKLMKDSNYEHVANVTGRYNVWLVVFQLVIKPNNN